MDVFHAMSANPRVKCATCGSGRMKRMLGTGAGIIFKGSGFYETDYKNNGKGKPETAGKSDSTSEGKTESKSESKSEAKSESKADKSKKGKSGGEAA